MPSRSQYGRLMKESFDQQAGQSPSPSTGSRQTAHKRGKARSSAARSTARVVSAARLSRGSAAMLTGSPMRERYRSGSVLSSIMPRSPDAGQGAISAFTSVFVISAAPQIRGRDELGADKVPVLQRTTYVLRCARDTPPRT